MSARYWIKAYVEILDDPKMGHLPDRAWRRAMELFLVAGELNRDGWIPETDELAWRLRCDRDELVEDLATLERVNIIVPNGHGWTVRQFAQRQAPVNAADRQRHHRNSQKRSKYYGHEPSHSSVTKRDTESEKIREERDRSESSLTEQNNAPVTKRDASVTNENDELWKRISEALRQQLTKATYDRWFLSGRLLRVEAGQVVIGLQTNDAVWWVRRRLGQIVIATVERELGRGVVVEYEVIA